MSTMDQAFVTAQEDDLTKLWAQIRLHFQSILRQQIAQTIKASEETETETLSLTSVFHNFEPRCIAAFDECIQQINKKPRGASSTSSNSSTRGSSLSESEDEASHISVQISKETQVTSSTFSRSSTRSSSLTEPDDETVPTPDQNNTDPRIASSTSSNSSTSNLLSEPNNDAAPISDQNLLDIARGKRQLRPLTQAKSHSATNAATPSEAVTKKQSQGLQLHRNDCQKQAPETGAAAKTLKRGRASNPAANAKVPVNRDVPPPTKRTRTDTQGDAAAPTIEQMIASLFDRHAVRRLFDHFTALMQSRAAAPAAKNPFEVSGSLVEQASQLWILYLEKKSGSSFHELQSLLAGVHLVKRLDDEAAKQNFTNIVSSVRDKVFGPGLQVCTANAFKQRLKRWRKIRQLFWPNNFGLLALMGLRSSYDQDCGQSTKMPTLYDFQSIRNVDILRFQQELEQRLKGQGLDDLERQIAKRPPYAADPVDLARMGQDIIKAIYEGTDPQPRLVYQLPPHTLKLGLCHRELQRLIGVRYIKENVYSHKKCDPSIDWPAGLQPEEPDRIPADDTGPFCELCNENQCGCIGSCYDSATGDVRIIFYGDKGFGLEAVLKAAATAVNCVSRIAFCKGDMIGELVGTLVPPDTCQDSRAMELVRGDLPEEPTVGQIFSGQATSIFYFVNHQCKHPNTAFEWKRISGRYRCQIVALRDIEGGEELTVFCGNDFMDKDKCLCADCI